MKLQKIVLVSVCCLFGLLAKPLQAADIVGKWTGSHTRLAWVQDQGDGADTFARSQQLMLYGYDSEDGRGERPIVPEKGNYFKPLFTPDGKQVVYSNRNTRRIYLVDFDSGKKRDLGSGVAVAVWEDPKKSLLLRRTTVWVYCFDGPQPENKYGTAQPLYRFPLDNPDKKELVWDKTNMAWSNIQLSRDGALLGGLFPWPHGGVLWTGDNRWQRLGRGCWTSLSPDDSRLLWIFDGLHRNIQIHDLRGGKNWQVKINSAPGMNGYEVYHPRWSNHPRYFVVTGPYEKGDGGNRIGGGGEKVELYLGRFDAGARKVEDWLRVTANNKADFYPDVWIDGGRTANLEDGLAVAEPAATPAASWPAGQDHLLFAWENLQGDNQVGQDSPAGFYQCNLELHGPALHSRHLQFWARGGWASTGEAGQRIGGTLVRSGAMSVEFVVTPQKGARGRIMVLARGDKRLLTITQNVEDLIISNAAGADQVVTGLLTAEKPRHLVLVFDGNEIEWFVDGRSGGRGTMAMDFAAMSADTLVIGDAKGYWHGLLENIAIYNTALDSETIATNVAFVRQEQGARKEIATLVVHGLLAETTEIPAPENIGAYSRALVVNTYDVLAVEQGDYQKKKALVAEWAVLDRQIIKSYPAEPQPEQLVLEDFAAHPELEGERQMMDVFEPDLDMYYRLPPS